MATHRKPHSASNGRSVFLIAALAVLFALRSLVPVGFMPDQAALNEGKLRIEKCGPDGISYSYIKLGAEQSSSQRHHTTTSAYSCIFCVLSAQGLMSGSSADFISTVTPVGLSQVAILYMQPFPQQNAGPPLGPRAPPSFINGLA